MLTSRNVHLIELPLGATRTVNAVLVEGDPFTLVDTGVRDDASLTALERAFTDRGRRIEELEQIVITHPHHDHFGAAAELVRRSGARLVGDGMKVMAEFPESFRPNSAHRISYFEEAGAPEPLKARWRSPADGFARVCDPVVADGELVEGDQVRMGGADWQVLSTPGHARTSISLWQPESRLLIAGDMLIGNAGASVTLHAMARPGRWLIDILASLEKLARLEPAVAYPGHGPLIEDAAVVVPRRRERAIQRLDDVARKIAERPWAAYPLSEAMYPPAVGTTSLGLSQSIGYLEALVVQERATSEIVGDLREYRRS
jgi:glyoxylase-like metal-dependent hydrolase (beta-lactamase superfamily II)